MEAVDDLVERQRADAGRGQFDRQRHAVERSADLGHGGGVVVGRRRSRAGPGGRGRRTARWPRRPATATAPDHVTSPGTPVGSRLVARICSPGQAPSSSAASDAVASSRCSQLSSTTSICRSPTNLVQRFHRRAARLVGQAQRTRDGHRHHGLVGDRCQVDVADAVAILGCDLRRDLDRQPRLASAAGTRQGHEPVVAQQSLVSRPSARRGRRNSSVAPEGCGLPVLFDTRSGGNSLRRSGWHSCETRSGRGRSRSSWVPRSVSQASSGSQSATSCSVAPGQHRLAAMRQIAQPRGAVDGRADVVALVAQLHLAGVHTDAQPDRRQRRPLQDRAHTPPRRWRGRTRRRSCRPRPVRRAARRRGRRAGRPSGIKSRNGGRHIVRLGLPQPRGALDVGQQQRHRAGRKLAHDLA